MGKTTKDILDIASSQLGVKESPAGSNRVKYNTAYYGREVSGSAYPWCCAFVWWVFQQAGAEKLFYGGRKTASCTTLYNYYRKQGRTVPAKQARPGDLVFFNFDGNPGVMNHIGVCESCADGYITTIDGNTGTGNEANGGAVMRRRRELNYVGGVARPDYGMEETDMTREEVQALVDEAVMEALSAREAAQAVRPVSDWAEASWSRAKEAGIFDGTKPAAPLSREQAAVVLDRLGLIKEGV